MIHFDTSSAALIDDGRRFRLLLRHFDDLFWCLDGQQIAGLYRGGGPLHWELPPQDGRLHPPQPAQRWPGSIPVDDQALIVAAFASLGDSDDQGQRREAFAVEYRLDSQTQGLRWIRDRGIAEFAEDGSIAQVIGIAEDITERRSIEKLLQDSEHELRIVTSAMPVGIAHIDRDLRYRFVNNAHARRHLAASPASIVPRTLLDVLGPETMSLIQPRLDQVLSGWTVDYEMELPLPAGRLFLHVTLVPEYDERKQVRGFIAVTEDISERKRAQARLLEREREFKTLAENAPDVIARVNRELQYLYLNRAAESSFGVCRDQYVGRDAADLGFPPAYIESTTPMIGSAFVTGIEQSVSFVARLDGVQRHFLVRAVPEPDGGDRLQSLLLIIYDVSERMRAEIERDRLLASEQLAREQAELALRSRDEFLAIVSHELRSPLNGIQNWAEVLRTTIADHNPLALQAVAGIKIGIEQQVRMIDDLLDATRIITGKLSLSLAPVLLLPVLHSALDSVRRQAEDKLIELSVDIRLHGEAVEGDSDRLQQVIWNLLSNAIKFTSRGGSVRLTANRVRDTAVIRVRDDGRGIDAEFMPQLFQRFQRDETGNSRGQDGFGLGLMLVRHLCELHRGSVSAASRGRGQGATFTVRLPLSIGLKADEVLRAWPPLPGDQLPGLGGVHLMLVDDHQESRDAMALLLSRAGARVEALGSGELAVQHFMTLPGIERPDLLICDIAMPGQDGYETLRQIRALERVRDLPPLPAIALTAFVQNEDRIRAHDAGFEMHLSKPVAIAELIVTIAAFVRHRTRG